MRKCFVRVQHVDSSSQNVFFGIQIKCSTAKISQNCMNQRYFKLFWNLKRGTLYLPSTLWCKERIELLIWYLSICRRLHGIHFRCSDLQPDGQDRRPWDTDRSRHRSYRPDWSVGMHCCTIMQLTWFLSILHTENSFKKQFSDPHGFYGTKCFYFTQ